MDFYMPVKIFDEENAVWNHKAEFTALGKKALIVTGKHSAKKNGSYEDVKKALESEGIAHVLFDEVEENPSMETVMKARDLGVAEAVDFVIGIGGGSPMDASKSIALMIVHKDEDMSYLYKKGVDGTALPVVAIPTTCGTGSEVTPYSILTNTQKNTKASTPHRIWAKYAFIDYRYLMSAPKKVLCDTAMDAFGHMVESYINANANEYSRMCVGQGLKIWARSKDALIGKRSMGTSDYKNLLTASAMAGMAISVSGTSLPHGLSYGLTCNIGTSHGKAVGYFLAGYMKEAAKEDRDYILETAGFADIEEFETYYEAACGKEDVSEELLQSIADGIMSNEVKLKNCPYKVDVAKINRIVGLE